MAVRRVVYFPDDPLTKKARPVETFDRKLEELAGDLFETMRAYEGVGLAAPQVGISKRLFVCQEPDGDPLCFVNPEIHDPEGREEGEEGCLSMPRMFGMVPRATQIRVTAQDLAGEQLEFEAENFFARIIQHETDHLNGILFPERLDIITRQEKLEEWATVREQLLADEAEAGEPEAGHAT